MIVLRPQPFRDGHILGPGYVMRFANVGGGPLSFAPTPLGVTIHQTAQVNVIGKSANSVIPGGNATGFTPKRSATSFTFDGDGINGAEVN